MCISNWPWDDLSCNMYSDACVHATYENRITFLTLRHVKGANSTFREEGEFDIAGRAFLYVALRTLRCGYVTQRKKSDTVPICRVDASVGGHVARKVIPRSIRNTHHQGYYWPSILMYEYFNHYNLNILTFFVILLCHYPNIILIILLFLLLYYNYGSHWCFECKLNKCSLMYLVGPTVLHL